MVKAALALIVIVFLIQIATSISSNGNPELGNNIILIYDKGLKWAPDPVNLFQGRPSFTSNDIRCPDSRSISSEITGPGQLNFAWKKNSNTTPYLSDYTNFSFYMDNIEYASCDKSLWENRSFEVGNGSHLIKWEFKLDKVANSRCPSGSHGQGWLAFIEYITKNASHGTTVVPTLPTPLTPPRIVPSAPRLNQVSIADMADLKKRVENSSDLMGVILLLCEGSYSGDLNINAKNFTLKPVDGQRVEIDRCNIKLNDTSHVTISNLILIGSQCEINLEGSQDCTIDGNRIMSFDGWGIYLGNGSSGNTISGNMINSLSTDDNDPPIYVYRSDRNNITCNMPNCNSAVLYYLNLSYSNNMSIYPGKFYSNNGFYNLDQNRCFVEIINSNNRRPIDFGSLTSYRIIGRNNWKCCQ